MRRYITSYILLFYFFFSQMGLTFFLLCSYLIWMVIMEMTSLNSSSVVQLWIICFCLVTKSCLTLCDCDSMDCSLPGSSVHGISQARILEWIVISFSGGSSHPRDQTYVSFIAGGFFTAWPIWEAHLHINCILENSRDITQIHRVWRLWLTKGYDPVTANLLLQAFRSQPISPRAQGPNCLALWKRKWKWGHSVMSNPLPPHGL